MNSELVKALKAKDPERFNKEFKIAEEFNGYRVLGYSIIPGKEHHYDLLQVKTGQAFVALDHDTLVLIKSGLLTLEVAPATIDNINITETVEE